MIISIQIKRNILINIYIFMVIKPILLFIYEKNIYLIKSELFTYNNYNYIYNNIKCTYIKYD